MIYYNYISFYFFILFIYPFFGVETFTPLGRLAHSSVLVENKLYFFVGVYDDGTSSNEVFYLDVSQQFNIRLPTFIDITTTSGMPFRSSWGTFLLSDINNEQIIYLFGGVTNDLVTHQHLSTSLVHTFNPKLGQWDAAVITGKQPGNRREIQGIIDDFGKIYIFGGFADLLIGSNIVKFFNEMVILNTNNLTWSYGSFALMRLYGHTATLLSDGTIVYIGGVEITVDNNFRKVDMNQINLYDTKLNTVLGQ